MSLRFLSLASGSSGNCYFLGTEEYGILIDAGIANRTIRKVLNDHGIPFEQIIAICITHDHADHIKSAGFLGEKCGIPIYTTAKIKVGMNRNYCMADKIYSAHREIIKDIPFSIRDFKITAFEVPHDGSDNVGYLIEYNNIRFAFATDLGEITPTATHYLEQADYLVIESNYDHSMLVGGSYPYHLKQRILAPTGHMDNADTANFLAALYTRAGYSPDSIDELKPKYVFLCHLSRDNNHPELAYKTVEQRLYEEGIRVGKDVQVVPLTRNHPSLFYHFE